jgi:hypothetical protein
MGVAGFGCIPRSGRFFKPMNFGIFGNGPFSFFSKKWDDEDFFKVGCELKYFGLG